MQDNIPDALIAAFERHYDCSWNDPALRNERLAWRAAWAEATKPCLHQIQEPAPAAVAVPDERAAFEVGILKYTPHAILDCHDGQYVIPWVQAAWTGWQARAALAATPAAVQTHAEAAAALGINSALTRIRAGNHAEAIAPLEHALRVLATKPAADAPYAAPTDQEIGKLAAEMLWIDLPADGNMMKFMRAFEALVLERAMAATPAAAATTLTPRAHFIKGWDAARMYLGMQGSVDSDRAMRQYMAAIPSSYVEAAAARVVLPEEIPASNTLWMFLTKGMTQSAIAEMPERDRKVLTERAQENWAAIRAEVGATVPVVLPEPDAAIKKVMNLVKDWGMKEHFSGEAQLEALSQEATPVDEDRAKRCREQEREAWKAVESELRALLAEVSAPAGAVDIESAAKAIAIAVAKNCGSVPQLTFPDIYLGLKEFAAHQQADARDAAPALPMQLIVAINAAYGSNEWQGDSLVTELLEPACKAIAQLTVQASSEQDALQIEAKLSPVAQISLNTLRWWRELVVTNPSDLAPRIDAAIAEQAADQSKG